VIVAAVPSQSAPAQTDSAAPLVALGNLVRPGLGTVLGRLSAPPLAAGASPSATPTVARWAIVGKVVPYFGQSSGLVLTKYAWINIKTQAVEEHDVEPASALLGRLQGVR